MDPVTQIKLTRALIDIDSTTGQEGEAGEFLLRTLRSLGYNVEIQEVTTERFNVLATIDPPDVVFSTHFDCVPPFFTSREEDGRLHGRGSCDAKGTLVAQIAACERLRANGDTRVGMLFVVGEERGSDGAALANTVANGSRFLINGEPTDNRLGVATRGVYRARLSAEGRAAHSSQPHLGISAIEKLVDSIVALRQVDWPDDPELGRTFYTIGLISGGVAPNVIPPAAECEIMFRSVGPGAELRKLLDRHVGGDVTVADILEVPPVRHTKGAGIDTAVFSFTTDIPLLDRWGAPLLCGPGSVTLAHTADEYVEITALHQAVDRYQFLAERLRADLP